MKAITVTYNNESTIEEMLFGWYKAYDKCPLYIIDNASEDKTQKKISEWITKHPNADLTVQYAQCNRGFAAAVNSILETLPPHEDIILINPDVTIDSDAFLKVQTALMQFPRSIIGMRLRYHDGKIQPTVGSFPTVLGECLRALHIQKFFFMHSLVDVHSQKFSYENNAEVDQVMGAFFVIPGSVREVVGNLDNGFFVWYEEVDYCKRVKDKRFSVRFIAQDVGTHIRGHSFKQLPAWKRACLFAHSSWYYARKHLPWPLYFLVGICTFPARMLSLFKKNENL